MKKIGISNENIFGGLPEPVGSIWVTGCVSIAIAQTARLILMSFFFSVLFMCCVFLLLLVWFIGEMRGNAQQAHEDFVQRRIGLIETVQPDAARETGLQNSLRIGVLAQL